MTLNELVLKLQKYQEEYGDTECVISIDTPDAFNETTLDDVVLNIYESSSYKVCLCGEIIQKD